MNASGIIANFRPGFDAPDVTLEKKKARLRRVA